MILQEEKLWKNLPCSTIDQYLVFLCNPMLYSRIKSIKNCTLLYQWPVSSLSVNQMLFSRLKSIKNCTLSYHWPLSYLSVSSDVIFKIEKYKELYLVVPLTSILSFCIIRCYIRQLRFKQYDLNKTWYDQ